MHPLRAIARLVWKKEKFSGPSDELVTVIVWGWETAFARRLSNCSSELEMVKVGEQTGALGDMLNAVADFYDEEMETSMAKVLSLVEPVLLVFMAFIVAAMLLAFYLPLFEAISGVQRQGI